MTSDAQAAQHHADAVKTLAQPFRSIIALGDFLEEVGSLEQLGREVETQTAALITQRDALHTEMASASATLADLGTMADAKKEEAAQIILAAQATASAIVTDAREQAVRIQYEATRVTDAAEQDTANAKATLADIEQQIVTRQADLAALDAIIATTKTALSSL